MKTCACCNVALVPRPHEWVRHFERRTACSKSCAQRLRRKPTAALSPKTRYRQIKIGGRHKQLSRHIVETAIGRPLDRSEIVHHSNHQSLDDRLANYSITTAKAHSQHHNQKHPVTKPCAVCGDTFTPHPTKRARTQTCGRVCKGKLLSRRNAERIARAA